ncbi:hypothetical protein HS088_TW14G00301 [Tripterygium wilfordii]|uniref:HXXXD-type acyl-transferase family protein n=1 Tax=Tripterygium wilfordii TaxID=458696 RepID=A0A7J7CQL6_TRIWF|nr:uncharacterized acetyltransferase At3g50280-like [Tripterygium wilfordii]KAF5736166.1 hypothetical protein HS088_TW14G00301 [Tripterygium wilfordii]
MEIILISTSTVKVETSPQPISKIELTPWDLRLLPLETIQKGLLFHKPKPPQETNSLIQHLKTSLSRTLCFFPPLAGRLSIIEHEDNTSSFSIDCNNSGVPFVHAVGDGVTIADILEPIYVPSLLYSFFTLNGVKNYEGVSKPVFGVQVTELVDGIFIGCTANHVVADGPTFWNFFNSWAEISRGFNVLSKPPSFNREFLDGLDCPIRIPFSIDHKKSYLTSADPLHLRDRVFHFSKEKICELKSRANAEIGTSSISSLQSLLAHIWRSFTRSCDGLHPDQETCIYLAIGARSRVKSIPQQYFGNAVQFEATTSKVSDILERGLGYAAFEMNKMIALHTEEKLWNSFESWIRNPSPMLEKLDKTGNLGTSSSPRYDVYGNDFGWGRPIAVRSGVANKSRGKITVFPGAEEGSVDIEACLPLEILQAMASDAEFMNAVSI